MISGTSHKRRLFVGIELDESARASCAAVSAQLQRTGYVAKYEAAEKLHVTLAFLGYVEAQRYEEVLAALGAAARSTERFSVTLDKLGAFPHERKPRVVFVGAREQGASFRGLAHAVRQLYGALRFEFKTDSVAHVTISRVKPPHRSLPLIEFVPIALQIESLSLFESLPDPANKTSRYEIRSTAPLLSISS